MNYDCRWVESKLQEYLSESADSEIQNRIESHTETCATCRRDIEGYGRVDDVVRMYFDRRLARAERVGMLVFRPLRLAGAVAGLGALALVLWIGVESRSSGIDSFGETALTLPSSENPALKDGSETADVFRAKPAEAEPPTDSETIARTLPPDANVRPEAADFYVADAAGYLRTLDDYAGSILVLGVFEATGQEAFEQAYESYRSDTRLSFVGVRLNPEVSTQTRLPAFPMMVNRGSSLLGTPAGGFAIVTPDGEVYRRGSLENESLVDALVSSLEEIPGR